MRKAFSPETNMQLIYQKMFDSSELMIDKPRLIMLENMDYNLSTFKMPKIFKSVIKKVLAENKLRYSDLGGMKALKDQIWEYELALNPSIKKTLASLFVGNGVEEVLFASLKAILKLPENINRNEVIIFAPGYSLFETTIKVLGGKVQVVKGKRVNNFIPTQEAIKKAINSNTCAIVFANPNNPTAISYGRDYLKGLIKLAKKYDLFVISDEIYAEMVRSPKKHVSIISINKGFNNVVKVFGPSKDRPGMTGLKIGYLIGDPRLEESIKQEYLARNFTINILSEYVFLVDLVLRVYRVTGVLKNCKIFELSDKDIKDYFKTVESNRRKMFGFQKKVIKLLRNSEKVADVIMPDGCNMLFFRFHKDMSADDFFNYFLNLGVGLYSPDIFHIDEDEGSWSRICITQSFEKIEQGLKRFL